MAGATGPRSWPRSSAGSSSGRPDISEPDGGRFHRIARLVSFLLAPTLGYAVSRVVDGWSRHQPWAESAPWARWGLGMAALAAGGLAGYWALRALFRLAAPLFSR
jgi:hypothetical protein